jgi:phosphatidate cytidylyltransferase
MGTRVIVGVVLAVLAIVFITYGGYWFFGMMMAVTLLGLNEFYRLMRRYRPIALSGFVGAVLVICAAWFGDPVYTIGACAAGLLLTFAIAAVPGPKRGVSVRIAVTMLGLTYVAVGFAHLVFLRRLDQGMWLVLTVVFGAWAGDTVAYFAGRYFGATPMAPRLSPKKTWEGFICGFIGTVVVVVLLHFYYDITALHSLLLGLTIAVATPIGDLYESLLKRDVMIKDAGHVIPGHGGILDRFDGLIFAAVASFYLIIGVFH